MNEQLFLRNNEDAILRAQYPAYADYCADEEDYIPEDYDRGDDYDYDSPEDYYDPDGGFMNEQGEWEAYDDMGR